MFVNTISMRRLQAFIILPCSVFIIALCLFLLSSCSSVPDHARLIPNDAVFVAGINTGELGKKIAWSAIVGSDLFKEMQDRLPGKDAGANLAEAGIKVMSTSYVYAPAFTMTPTPEKPVFIALIPLDDAKKWEGYISRNFAGATISDVKGRREASLAPGLNAGWTKDLLIVTSGSPGAFLAHAFEIKKDSSLINDKRFKALEGEGHDITMWVNYERLISQSMGAMGTGGIGMQFGSSLWKGTALSSGFDFEKGKITGVSKYFVSDQMREASKEWSNENPSKEMLARLPGDNLDMLATMHLPPKYMKAALEKAGLLGFVNLGMAQTGLSADDLFEAFSGDMAFTINDFSMKAVAHTLASGDSSSITYNAQSADMNLLYVMGIGNKAKFDKLLSFAVTSGAMQAAGANTWVMGTGSSAFTMRRDDKYLVVGNKLPVAQSFIAGSYKNSNMPSPLKSKIADKPMTFYLDLQRMLAGVNPDTSKPGNMAMLAEARRLMKDFLMQGGEWKGDAFTYDMEMSFLNKDENALLLLIDFASKMKTISERYPEPAVPVPDTDTLAM